MPIHVAPAIRALEEALEAEGLIPKLDSVAVTIKKAQEASPTGNGYLGVKVVPVTATRIIRGNSYTAT